jgi:hypothetical protein
LAVKLRYPNLQLLTPGLQADYCGFNDLSLLAAHRHVDEYSIGVRSDC